MGAWLTRGVWMGLLHGAVQAGVVAVNVRSPEASPSVRIIAFGLVVVIAVLWGALDAWRGLDERGMCWFFAALVAGPSAGVLGVVGTGLLVDQTGTESLWPALTGGAAFTALVVLVSAAIGMGIGNLLPQPDGSRRSQA
ncbi:B-4DMT family transporter [Umezawaea sp. Da 62-37]|uniref:B-4DMT family transporter n=1 Tax=Umezawaea sp. Da 62-37 TaxID=3075927 RepID=UPI0028F734CE|nr:B-4DMT family transporter [Umezawaea sp. Da 62-37]WNV84187.1 B-4DMT family transporter [Umezawaea sp. Da 62-37]